MEKCKINIYLIIPVFNLDHVSFNIMHSFIFFNIFLINIDLTPPNIETCYIFCFRKKLIVERFVMVSFVRKSLIIIFSIRQPNTISKLGLSLFFPNLTSFRNILYMNQIKTFQSILGLFAEFYNNFQIRIFFLCYRVMIKYNFLRQSLKRFI